MALPYHEVVRCDRWTRPAPRQADLVALLARTVPYYAPWCARARDSRRVDIDTWRRLLVEAIAPADPRLVWALQRLRPTDGVALLYGCQSGEHPVHVWTAGRLEGWVQPWWYRAYAVVDGPQHRVRYARVHYDGDARRVLASWRDALIAAGWTVQDHE